MRAVSFHYLSDCWRWQLEASRSQCCNLIGLAGKRACDLCWQHVFRPAVPERPLIQIWSTTHEMFTRTQRSVPLYPTVLWTHHSGHVMWKKLTLEMRSDRAFEGRQRLDVHLITSFIRFAFPFITSCSVVSVNLFIFSPHFLHQSGRRWVSVLRSDNHGWWLYHAWEWQLWDVAADQWHQLQHKRKPHPRPEEEAADVAKCRPKPHRPAQPVLAEARRRPGEREAPHHRHRRLHRWDQQVESVMSFTGKVSDVIDRLKQWCHQQVGSATSFTGRLFPTT